MWGGPKMQFFSGQNMRGASGEKWGKGAGRGGRGVQRNLPFPAPLKISNCTGLILILTRLFFYQGKDMEGPNIEGPNVPKMEGIAQKSCVKCHVCTKCFSSKTNLTIHMRTHTGEKPFSCSVCQKSFTQKSSLTYHMRIHQEKPFTCYICKKAFHTEQERDVHHKTHYTSIKEYSCKVCAEKFLLKETLKLHMGCHSEEEVKRPYSCSVCQKSFPSPSTLVGHKRTHTGEKPFSCSVCQETFTWKSSLYKHVMRTHPESKEVFNKTRPKQSSPKPKRKPAEHKCTHLELKKLTCDICSKSFEWRSHLADHMRTHTGEKPFSCSACQKSFCSEKSRNKHTKTCSGWLCEVCGLLYASKQGLMEHRNNHTQ